MMLTRWLWHSYDQGGRKAEEEECTLGERPRVAHLIVVAALRLKVVD